MTEFVAVERAKVGSPTEAPTYAKAPRVTKNLYDEAMPMLFASSLVYEFTSLVNMAQDQSIDIKLPEGFPDLSIFMTESLDLRGENGGNGLSFHQMSQVLEFNQKTIAEVVPRDTFGTEVVAQIAERLHQSDGTDLGKNIFLATHRAIQQDIACVYSVVKDCNTKQIIVTFRGSQGTPFSTRDWQTNVNARLETLRTPKQIKDKMPEGDLQKRVLVHKGFHGE